VKFSHIYEPRHFRGAQHMPVLSRHAASRDATDALHLAPRTGRTAFEPMLPVVISSALFVPTLAIPFIVALLIQ
jgi:hypothetical protein